MIPGKDLRIALIAAVCALLLNPTLVRADERPDFDGLVRKCGDAFVTVKFVLKLGGQFGNAEREAEVTGVMIDPKGTVLCSNSRLGSARMMRQYGGSATPTDIKVLIGDDTEGLPARLQARDTELDLAWVTIKEPGDRKFTAIDLHQAAVPTLGQKLTALRKMAKYFDRAPTVSEGFLAGKTRKPRDLMVPGGSLVLEPGLPVFTASGEIVGVVVIQMPDDEELQNMAFMGIGRDISTGLILPAAEVEKATARARESDVENDESDESAATSKKDTGSDSARDVKKESDDKNEEDE